MGTLSEFDIGPLTWVKGEIDQALAQAGAKLAEFGAGGDATSARMALTHLHQVTGALQMVGLEGATRVCEEMERLVEAVARGDAVLPAPAALALLSEANSELSRYLDRLLNGDPDLPLRLLPLYRRLAGARGIEDASPVDLFFPDLSARPPRNANAVPVPEADLGKFAKGRRGMFQRGLLQWLRGDAGGLQTMLQTLRQVEDCHAMPMHRAFWWNAGALVEALAHDALPADPTVRQLFARFDQQLRRLGEGSPKVPERLLREVLYRLAQAAPATERVRQAQEIYQLPAYIPAAEEDSAERAEAERLAPLLREARERLKGVKESWLKFTSGTADGLPPFREQLDRLCTHCSSLDNAALRQLLATAVAAGAEVGRAKTVDETQAMEMATALLLADNALENYSRLGDEFANHARTQGARLLAAARREQIERNDLPLLDDIGRKAQEKLLLAQVCREIGNNLQQIEQVLDAYFRDSAKRDGLPGLAPSLAQILGALSMLELAEAADLLRGCEALIEKFAIPGEQAELQEQELLAEGLSSLGFYVEALQNGRADARQIIAPVLRRLRGEDEDEARQDAAEGSLEADVARRRRLLEDALSQWPARPGDEDLRGSLQDLVASLEGDEELLADPGLTQLLAQARSALQERAPLPAVPEVPVVVTAPPVAPSLPETSIDAELLQTYLEEAVEVLAAVATQFAPCSERPGDREALREIRRGFHTLKGSGRMVGLTDLGEAAWTVEQVLNKWLQDEVAVTPALLSFVQRAHADFSRWVDALTTVGVVDVDAAWLTEEAERLKAQEQAFDGVPAAEEPLSLESAEAAPEPVAEVVEVSVETLDTLAEDAVPAQAEPTLEEFAVAAEGTSSEAPLPSVLQSAVEEALPDIQPEAESALPAIEEAAAPAPPEELEIAGVTVSASLFATFMQEADQHLATLDRHLEQLRQPGARAEHEFLRAAHTLTGIARTLGFEDISDLGHPLEKWLEILVRRPEALDDKRLQLTADSIGGLHKMVDALRDRQRLKPARQQIRSLRALLKKVSVAPEPAPSQEQAVAENVRAAAAGPLVEQTPAVAPVQAEAMPDEVAPDGEGEAIADQLDPQLLPIFLQEANELMPQIGSALRAWQGDPDSGATLALQRALHTLKGSARMAGAWSVGEATHRLEAQVIAAGESGSAPIFDELDQEFDAIAERVDALDPAATRAEPPEPTLPIVAEETAAEPQLAQPAVQEAAAGQAMLRVRADVADRLVNQAGEVSIARSRIEGEMHAMRQSLLELTENVVRLRGQLREIEIQAETQLQSRLSMAQEINAAFDPLEFDRFTRFQELTRMMAESVNDVATVQQNLLVNVDETQAALTQQARMSRELQQQLMRVRMVPLNSVAERLHRIVRQTARELGKQAGLEILGGQSEIDRGVLEQMAAPLEHLLRNAVAHGIEPPDERAAAGKAELGQIRVAARQEGNEIVLTFSDDGAGLDLERIRRKAVDLGMIRADQDVNPNRLMGLIFTPGFSTAAAVTQVSGRGVGMDVVRNEIIGLGGRIEVNSAPQQGTTFTIYLPLTLAVQQVVLVRAAGVLYALPSNTVEQVQEYKPDALAAIYQHGEVSWLDNRYPFAYLPRLLGDTESKPTAQRYTPVLLLRSGTQRAGIHVDELIKNQEVVVKNIGPQLARVPGVAGATVMGDGKVVLILNPVLLANRQLVQMDEEETRPLIEEKLAPLAMVVDDSLTVRKITSRLLAREGYDVVTARDGVDALQQMQEVLPDVMLVDIEMPRMDGFELTKNIRADARTSRIPIIMITSRTADKHRNYAKELGVDVYLGKPYQEEELLGHMAELLKR